MLQAYSVFDGLANEMYDLSQDPSPATIEDTLTRRLAGRRFRAARVIANQFRFLLFNEMEKMGVVCRNFVFVVQDSMLFAPDTGEHAGPARPASGNPISLGMEAKAA